MLLNRISFMLFFFYLTAFSQRNDVLKKGEINYFNKDYFLIEGTSIADSLKECSFDRLPISYKNKVRPEVWKLSKPSAGLSVLFSTNSTSIHVKWSLLNNVSMNHMADTGAKGLDLYWKNHHVWEYINVAKPFFTPFKKNNEALLISNMTRETRDYKLYLPLYDGLTDLQIGIDSISHITKPKKKLKKPILFYGTSITQGACASRPGMTHTNIISRKMGLECINFGFSGNGKMELAVAELLRDTDAQLYVIDCVPNMDIKEIKSNLKPLVTCIREANKTPIVIVESTRNEHAFLDSKNYNIVSLKNAALREVYLKLEQEGYQNLYYISSYNALGSDHEATIDGVHFTDLGFMRYADFLIEKFSELNLFKKR